MSTRLEDEAQIRELFSRYAFNMDDGNFAGVADLFTEEGRWVAKYGSAVGRKDIDSLLSRINPRADDPKRKHFVLNTLITFDRGTAQARTSFLVFLNKAGDPAAIVAGTYEDQLIKEDDGKWRFAVRVLNHDIASKDLALRL